MKRIFVPTQNSSDWQRLLADPEKQWKKGYSAMATADSWENANGGMPQKIGELFKKSGQVDLDDLELLLALPEWKVSLKPANSRPSQSDVFALARNEKGLVAICVESKVDEPFNESLSENQERIEFLKATLELDSPVTPYQLLHRTASAVLTSQDFHAGTAVMLVHSFSEKQSHFDRFKAFCEAMSAKQVAPGIELYSVVRIKSPRLYLGWCQGENDKSQQ